jgi:glyoxylase-like metal-dependent hydrolase (beta-lactamase superfamily II)
MPKPQAIIIPVTPFQQNCCLIWDSETKEAAVIDPGGDIDRVVEAVRREGVTPVQILLTHGHIDHAGGA